MVVVPQSCINIRNFESDIDSGHGMNYYSVIFV